MATSLERTPNLPQITRTSIQNSSEQSSSWWGRNAKPLAVGTTAAAATVGLSYLRSQVGGGKWRLLSSGIGATSITTLHSVSQIILPEKAVKNATMVFLATVATLYFVLNMAYLNEGDDVYIDLLLAMAGALNCMVAYNSWTYSPADQLNVDNENSSNVSPKKPDPVSIEGFNDRLEAPLLEAPQENSEASKEDGQNVKRPLTLCCHSDRFVFLYDMLTGTAGISLITAGCAIGDDFVAGVGGLLACNLTGPLSRALERNIQNIEDEYARMSASFDGNKYPVPKKLMCIRGVRKFALQSNPLGAAFAFLDPKPYFMALVSLASKWERELRNHRITQTSVNLYDIMKSPDRRGEYLDKFHPGKIGVLWDIFETFGIGIIWDILRDVKKGAFRDKFHANMKGVLWDISRAISIISELGGLAWLNKAASDDHEWTEDVAIGAFTLGYLTGYGLTSLTHRRFKHLESSPAMTSLFWWTRFPHILGVKLSHAFLLTWNFFPLGKSKLNSSMVVAQDIGWFLYGFMMGQNNAAFRSERRPPWPGFPYFPLIFLNKVAADVINGEI